MNLKNKQSFSTNKTSKQAGQVVVILLLVMVLVLAIALSVVGRSITEISTSTKTENSSRAFSAAEAGIEKAVKNIISGGTVSFDNEAQADVEKFDLPRQGYALENSSITKGTFAQFWLANPDDLDGDGYPDRYYGAVPTVNNATSFDIYFGSTIEDYSDPNEKPGIEVHLISRTCTLPSPCPAGVGYSDQTYFFDSYQAPSNGRTPNAFSGCSLVGGTPLETNEPGNMTSFYCKATVSGFTNSATTYPVMARVRILYSSKRHPVALQPSSGSSLPVQSTLYRSKGSAGTSQRVLELQQFKKVIPDFFDFALFSNGTLDK